MFDDEHLGASTASSRCTGPEHAAVRRRAPRCLDGERPRPWSGARRWSGSEHLGASRPIITAPRPGVPRYPRGDRLATEAARDSGRPSERPPTWTVTPDGRRACFGRRTARTVTAPKVGPATSVDGTTRRRPQAGTPGDLGRQADRTADTARASGPPAPRRRPDPSHGEADTTTSVIGPTGPWQRRGHPGHLGDPGGRQPTRRGRPDHLGGQADRTIGPARPGRPPRWTDRTSLDRRGVHPGTFGNRVGQTVRGWTDRAGGDPSPTRRSGVETDRPTTAGCRRPP